MTPVVELHSVTREFAGTVAVRDVDLTVARGQFAALLGPSGCGKTTTLRMIAGYLEPTRGRILLEEKDATRLPPERRNIGMVFQSYALFPHLTVAGNVAFGLQMRRLPKDEIRTRVQESLELVGLADLGGRRPRELSGGQQQRVALARAVAVRPSVLLLDEPLSNLDARLRVQMRQELLRIQRETGLTAILVTHDQSEALEVADTMVILDRGEVAQQGHPREVFRAPATRFVAEFLGYENFLDLPGSGPSTIRPEHVRLTALDAPAPGTGHLLSGTVTTLRFRGTDSVATVEVDGQPVQVVTDDDSLRPGQRAQLFLPAPHVVTLPDGGHGPGRQPAPQQQESPA